MHLNSKPISGSMLSLLTGLFLFASSTLALADDTDSWGLDGSRIRLVERIEEKSTGTEHALRAQLRLNGWVNLDSAGCLKARARITSGNSFNSEWMQTGIGKGSADVQIGLRHLYLDYKCIESNVRIEAGAFSARPAGGPGNLGPTEVGWIDGLRVTITNEEKIRDIYLSVGEVSDTKNPNLLTRKHTGINHAMLEIKQVVNKDVTAHASIARQDKQIFSRAGLNWVITQYIGWIKNMGANTSVGAEALVADDHLIGGMIYSDFNLKTWRVRTFVTRITPNPSDEERLNLLFKNFYGYGSNAYFELSHDIFNKKMTLNLRARVGDAGKLVEAGITVPLQR